MEEIERFRGVRLILALPPLIALCLYLFDSRFGSGAQRPRDVFLSPVLTYQLFAGIAVIGLGALMLVRSGNESDISPSPFEMALRHALTHVLSVRPRFKEFVVGFPCMMILPALLPAHRRAIGWLLALGIGVGIGDIIDTFSHLHTPLEISILRVVIGLVIGAYTRRDRDLDLPARRAGRLTVRLLISGYYGFGNLGRRSAPRSDRRTRPRAFTNNAPRSTLRNPADNDGAIRHRRRASVGLARSSQRDCARGRRALRRRRIIAELRRACAA